MQRVFAAIFLILSIVAAIASLAPAVNWFVRWVLFHIASSLTDTVLCRINGDLTISSVSYSYTESLWKSCYSGECSNSAFLFLIPLVWKHSLISSRLQSSSRPRTTPTCTRASTMVRFPARLVDLF